MRSLALPALLAALALAGCGSSNSSDSSSSSSKSGGYGSQSSTPAKKTTAAASTAGGAAQTVKTKADEDGKLYFNPTKLTAKAGAVTITMQNPSSSGIAHGIGIEGNGVDKDGPIVQAGGTSTIKVNLKAGTYEFYCPIPSHKSAGMKGTLTVS
jgi:uncharacterized cupredoxin-like copper-binding protein